MLTVDELLEQLEKAKKTSPLGGDTVVHLCKEEEEYQPFDDAGLEVCGDGAVFLLRLPEPTKSGEKKFLHDFDMMFSVRGETEDPDDIPVHELLSAALARLDGLKEGEFREAFGHCGCMEYE